MPFVWSLMQCEDEAWEKREFNLLTGAAAAVGLEFCLGSSEVPATKQVCERIDTQSGVLAASMLQEELIGDQQPFFGHFYPGGLGLIATKVSVVALSGRLRAVQKRIEEMEEEDEESIMQIELADVLAPSRHEHHLSIWKGFGRNLRIGVIRDMAIISVQRLYEVIAIRFFVDRKMGKSLVKNCPRSAVRKSERYYGTSSLFYMSKVGATAFKGQIMFWMALFSVNQAIDTWYTYRGTAKKSDALGVPRNDTYARRLVLNALRCSGACCLAAVGAAVGSAIKPGLGTNLGMNIAPQFIFLLI